MVHISMFRLFVLSIDKLNLFSIAKYTKLYVLHLGCCAHLLLDLSLKLYMIKYVYVHIHAIISCPLCLITCVNVVAYGPNCEKCLFPRNSLETSTTNHGDACGNRGPLPIVGRYVMSLSNSQGKVKRFHDLARI